MKKRKPGVLFFYNSLVLHVLWSKSMEHDELHRMLESQGIIEGTCPFRTQLCWITSCTRNRTHWHCTEASQYVLV